MFASVLSLFDMNISGIFVYSLHNFMHFYLIFMYIFALAFLYKVMYILGMP